MNKHLNYIALTVVVGIVLILIRSYLDRPTVYVDVYNKCVAVKLSTGEGSCNNIPDTYEKVIINTKGR